MAERRMARIAVRPGDRDAIADVQRGAAAGLGTVYDAARLELDHGDRRRDVARLVDGPRLDRDDRSLAAPRTRREGAVLEREARRERERGDACEQEPDAEPDLEARELADDEADRHPGEARPEE